MKKQLYIFSFFCCSLIFAAEEKQEPFSKFDGMTLSTKITIDPDRDVHYGLAPQPGSIWSGDYRMSEVSCLATLIPIKQKKLKAHVNGNITPYSQHCDSNEEKSWNETYLPFHVIGGYKNNTIEGFLQTGTTQHYWYGQPEYATRFHRHNDLIFTQNKSFMPWKTTYNYGDRVHFYNRESIYYIPITIKINNKFLKILAQKLDSFNSNPKIFLLHDNYNGVYLFDLNIDENRKKEIAFIMSEEEKLRTKKMLKYFPQAKQ